MLPGLLHQLSLGVRGLRQRLSFSLLALISLGLGIGASVAIYAVVDAVLLQPLPYAEAERLVQVEEVDAEGRKMPLAEPNLDDLRARHRGLVALAEYSGGVTTVSSANRAVRAGAYLVGPEFLQVLQVQPVIGSDLGTAGTEPGALVSHRYWQETLGASANLSGRSVSAFGLNLPIVGVMPESFQFPEGAQLWMDARAIPLSESRSAHNWSVIARLRDGVDMAQAQEDARAIGAALRREHGSDVDLAAFATDDLPKPDTTTLAGRRIYYSHIDGDGWRNVSLADEYAGHQVISARVILEEAIRPFPDLPVTVSPNRSIASKVKASLPVKSVSGTKTSWLSTRVALPWSGWLRMRKKCWSSSSGSTTVGETGAAGWFWLVTMLAEALVGASLVASAATTMMSTVALAK